MIFAWYKELVIQGSFHALRPFVVSFSGGRPDNAGDSLTFKYLRSNSITPKEEEHALRTEFDEKGDDHNGSSTTTVTRSGQWSNF